MTVGLWRGTLFWNWPLRTIPHPKCSLMQSDLLGCFQTNLQQHDNEPLATCQRPSDERPLSPSPPPSRSPPMA
eukprot:3172137-Pyramimonas_sp.AAC.1